MTFAAPRVVAHRGVPSVFPENTLVSLTRALAFPYCAQGLEFDVRMSRDGHLFVFHDADTERLVGVRGTIEDRTSDQIDLLRVSGEPIPRLSQLIQSCLALIPEGESRLLNVEIKMPRDPAMVVGALRPLLDPLVAEDRIELVVSSFDPRVLASALSQGAPWRCALLYESLDVLVCLDGLERDKLIDLHPAESLVTAEHMASFARADEQGRRRVVRTWTVDNPQRARALASLGVDAIITNEPGRLWSALWSC